MLKFIFYNIIYYIFALTNKQNMKTVEKIIIGIALLGAVLSTFAQRSEYNKGKKLVGNGYCQWGVYKNSEAYLTRRGTEGYYISKLELDNVLNFYSINESEVYIDASELKSDINDAKLMSSDLLNERSIVTKIWIKNNTRILWACSDVGNLILISKIK